MDTLKDVQKYLEYQLQSTLKYIAGWGSKEAINLLRSGIHNTKIIIDFALSDPEKFHEFVERMNVYK